MSHEIFFTLIDLQQCDKDTPCKNCPAYDSTATHDHWRVVGCHRGPLKDLRCLSQSRSQYLRQFVQLLFTVATNIPDSIESASDITYSVIAYVVSEALSKCNTREMWFSDKFHKYCLRKDFLDNLQHLLETYQSRAVAAREPAYKLSDLFDGILKDKEGSKHVNLPMDFPYSLSWLTRLDIHGYCRSY